MRVTNQRGTKPFQKERCHLLNYQSAGPQSPQLTNVDNVLLDHAMPFSSPNENKMVFQLKTPKSMCKQILSLC